MSTTLRERPILFSEAEVLATLAGRKTQLRRVVNPQPPADAEAVGANSCEGPEGPAWFWWKGNRDERNFWPPTTGGANSIHCPFGQPGDQMWLRETWALVHNWEEDGIDDWEGAIPKDRPISPSAQVWHKAGHLRSSDTVEDRGFRWRPSIHMPRWASRLTLEITNIRVERVQEISEEDARAEGVLGESVECDVAADPPGQIAFVTRYRQPYMRLWDSINGVGSWVSDPWVWAITFKAVKP